MADFKFNLTSIKTINQIKPKLIFSALVLVSILFNSCDYDRIRAKGEVTEVFYGFSDYSELRVSDAFNVYVSFSDTEESIHIRANDNLHDKIIVKNEDNKLYIKLKNFTYIRGNATLDAYIVTNDISNFDIAGASHLYLEDEWTSENGDIELTGASEFSGEVNIERLNINLHGASNLDIYGNVDYLNADLSGSSDIRDYDLIVNRLNMELSGASDAFLTVNESIDIKATGASTFNYKGEAVIDREELAGASEIRNRN
ncbi:MAG: head GIN domain-containing protein [Maribacter sp.]